MNHKIIPNFPHNQELNVNNNKYVTPKKINLVINRIPNTISEIKQENVISEIKLPNITNKESIIREENMNYNNELNTKDTELSAIEKEKIRLQKAKEAQIRYREKTKAYKEIALISGDKEKISKLLILCFPELSQVEQYVLDLKIYEFIATLHTLMKK